MTLFQCDYSSGCHPKVLEAIAQANAEELEGYGLDKHTKDAEKQILEKCDLKDGVVFFTSAGTQANLAIIASLLRPDESVLTADCGHIRTQETGAIEATGHAVDSLAGDDGKVHAEVLEQVCLAYRIDESASHLTRPALVYLSFPNENGATYSLQELEDISNVCRRYNMFFYLDGARLSYGLAAQRDVTFADIARLTDVFYIGGTKCGALCSEAIVFREKNNAVRFDAHLRQRGALLARGWFLAVQFEALLKEDIYFRLGIEANAQSMRLQKAFKQAGIEVLCDSQTNMQFVRLSKNQAQFLQKYCGFRICRHFPDGSLKARFCTTWATTSEAVTNLIAVVNEMRQRGL